MRALLLIVFCILLAGCVTQPAPLKPPVALNKDEADVYEALLRHRFPGHEAVKLCNSYFISIQGADPSDQFLERFSGQHPTLKGASESTAGDDSRVYDRVTGDSSLVFSIGAIHWLGKNTVEVGGGIYEGNLGADSHTYRLVRIRNKWKVVIDTLESVSDARPISSDIGCA